MARERERDLKRKTSLTVWKIFPSRLQANSFETNRYHLGGTINRPDHRRLRSITQRSNSSLHFQPVIFPRTATSLRHVKHLHGELLASGVVAIRLLLLLSLLFSPPPPLLSLSPSRPSFFFGPHTCEVIPATVTPVVLPSPASLPPSRQESEELRRSSRIPLTQPEQAPEHSFPMTSGDQRPLLDPSPLLASPSFARRIRLPRNGRKTLGILGLAGDTSGYASEAFEVFFFSFLFSLASLFSFSSRFRLGRSVLEMGVRVHEGGIHARRKLFFKSKGNDTFVVGISFFTNF